MFPLTIISIDLANSFSIFFKIIGRMLLFFWAFSFFQLVGLYLYCKLFNITHFITSRYFINFLPLFFITLYLSLDAIELRFERLKRLVRSFKALFVILFIASNLVIFPLYYRSEKQDFRGLVNYLNSQLRDGDKIFVRTFTYIPGILHYFGVDPKNRHYEIPYYGKILGKRSN